MIITILGGVLALATLIWLWVRRNFPELLEREDDRKRRRAPTPDPLPLIGLPLIELLLAMAAGIALLVSAVALYLDVRHAPEATDLVKQLHQTISSTRTLFTTTSSFGSANLTPVLVKAKVFRDDELKDGTPVHALGGTIVVWGRGRGFEISFNDLPQGACATLLSMTELGASLKNVIVNKTSVGARQLDPAAAILRCPDPNRNSITWIFQ